MKSGLIADSYIHWDSDSERYKGYEDAPPQRVKTFEHGAYNQQMRNRIIKRRRLNKIVKQSRKVNR